MMWLIIAQILSLLIFIPASTAFAPPLHHHARPRDLLSSSLCNVDAWRRPRTVVASISDGTGSLDKFRYSSNDDSASPPGTAKKPLLASALETMIRWTIKCVLFRQCATLAVGIGATSNRELLRGRVSALSISARDCAFRFNFLSLKRWDVTGNDLRLGYLPLLLPFLPYAAWRARRMIWLALCSASLLNILGYPLDLRSRFRATKELVYRRLGARPSTINYSLAVTEDDIAQSMALKFWLQGVLRALVENSVVGAAAVFGDAAKELDAEIGTRQRNTQAGQRGVPLLPSSSIMGTGTAKIASSSAISPSLSSGSRDQSEQQGLLTSALLSATSFELKGASLSQGRIVLNAEAVMPMEEGSGKQQNPLSFTIRAKIAPTRVVDEQQQPVENGRLQPQQEFNALGFTSPECRVNTSALTSGSILRRIIPDVVWVPFGLGVAVPFGALYRAEVSGGSGNDGQACRIDGSLTMF